MSAVRPLHDPLAHFERETPEEGGELAGRTDTRGVGWVLKWYAALGVLLLAASVLIEFGYCLAAERSLLRAARAGALEATLPQASFQSVEQTVERRLAGYPPELSSRLRLNLQQNGAPIRGAIRSRDGDRLSVALSVPVQEILPGWLRTIGLWRGDAQIAARAERQMPGRHLAGG